MQKNIHYAAIATATPSFSKYSVFRSPPFLSHIFHPLHPQKRRKCERENKKIQIVCRIFFVLFSAEPKHFFVSHSSRTSRHPPNRKKNSESFVVCVPRSYLRFSLHVYVKKKKNATQEGHICDEEMQCFPPSSLTLQNKSLAHFFSYDECLHIYLVCEQIQGTVCAPTTISFCGWLAVQRHHGLSSSYFFLYARKEHFFVNMERMRR